jgi:hypothetical protein
VPFTPRLALLAVLVAPILEQPAEAPGNPVLHGLLLLPDGGSAAGLRAYIRAGAAADSADIAADGSFTVPLAEVRCDSVDIEIDSPPGGPRRYHVAYARMRVTARPSASTRIDEPSSGPAPLPLDVAPATRDSIRIVLVPTTFTIGAGTHAGTTVPISIGDVAGAATQRMRFWRVSRAARGYGSPVSWSDSSFPLPVALDGGPTRDTAAFWAIARQLERDIGRPLFRPAPLPRHADDESGHVVVRFDAGSHSAGMTFITYDNWGTVYHASVELRSTELLRDPRVVTHELVHALGAGHAPWWPSVMGAPEYTTNRATAADAAHTQLLYAVRRAHIEGRATHGLAEAAAARRPIPLAPATGCAADAPATIPSR